MLGSVSLLGAAFLALEAVIITLGLAISAIAFRGYRRHGSRPMGFVALGFVLLVGLPAVLTLWVLLVGDLDRVVRAVINRLGTAAGMVSILYGLWTDPGE